MFVVLILAFITAANALPQGAPSKVCQTMLPFHGGGIKAQADASPFQVTAIPMNGGAHVVIESSINLPFEGYMLQGRTINRELVGIFETVPEGSHTLDCFNSGDSLTHNNPNKKNVVDAFWKPTDGYDGPVIFNATIAQDYLNFWVGVESTPIIINKRSTVEENVPSFPTRSRPRITTPPYFQPEISKEASTEFDPFYTGCDVTKLCFGAPSNCIASRNCKAAVTVTVNGDRYEFEMKALNNAAWVGVGLSDDARMGDDSIVECVVNGKRVETYMSYTSARPNLGVERLANPQLGIKLLNYSITDDALYCKVLRDAKTIVHGREFDLINDKYYLLVAAGSEVQSNKVGYHTLAYEASGEKKSLADVTAVMAASKLLLRLHGAFMLAAWLGAASVGILLARYYRQTWVGSTMCGKDQWFAWHRMFMVLTWALTTTGFILIFVELKAWTTETNNPHAILGIIITAICFIQPIGAYFRPHPGATKRAIFNWLHWLGGNVAHILAIVTIFFSVKLAKAELPEWFDYIMAAFVAFHVCMHLLLSILGCISDKAVDRRVNSFPMKDLAGSGRTSSYIDRNDDAPHSGARKFLLAIYIIVVEVIVIVLILITVLAPIEDFWNDLQDSVNNSN